MRLGLALAGLVAIALAALGGRWWLGRRVRSNEGGDAGDLLVRYGLSDGKAAILYLWGARCVPCVTLQEPALARVEAAVEVEVRKVEAVADGDLTRRFSILTVPSTVVIGVDRRIRAVNLGYADDTKLLEQLTGPAELTLVR